MGREAAFDLERYARDDYAGCAVMISHDRFFLDRIARAAARQPPVEASSTSMRRRMLAEKVRRAAA